MSACVFDLTFTSGGGRGSGGVTGGKATKPVTTVQRRLSTFVSSERGTVSGRICENRRVIG